MPEFVGPLKWELVPSRGSEVFDTYRALIDGKGWLVCTMLKDETNRYYAISATYLPDESEMWGK